MRKNQNIRAVFINKESTTCAEKFLATLEKQEVKVILLQEKMQSSEDWLKVIETAKIPQFHCVACDSTALGIESAKKAGLRTVAVQTKELENVANQFVNCLDDIDVDIISRDYIVTEKWLVYNIKSISKFDKSIKNH